MTESQRKPWDRGPQSAVSARGAEPESSRDDTVVHLSPQLRLGAGRYVLETALEQTRRGRRVFVGVGTDSGGEWCSDPRMIEELRAGGVRVFSAGDLFHRSTPVLLDAVRVVRAALPEPALRGTAHAHAAMAAAVARKAGFATVVATCHGWNPQRQDAFNLQDSLAFGLTDAITSPSACWAAALEREMGIENVTVVPVGLDLRRYPSTEARHSERAATSIVTLAELTARKGIGDLLEAMPTVWRHAPAVQLHLFGDGDAREGLEARAAELDPSRTRIFFHGFVTEPYRRLRDFDLFCFPSRSDNFPVALMEAMLARLPVVATDVGGIPELVARSGCGHVVPPETPAALAAEIAALLDLPAERRCDLGARGERFVRQHCGIETTVTQLDAVYAAARGGASVPGRRPWTPRPCA